MAAKKKSPTPARSRKAGRPQAASKPSPPTPPRSRKAGRPPVASASSPQAQRRRKTATAAVSKGTTLLQNDEGSRAAWSGAKPMWNKR